MVVKKSLAVIRTRELEREICREDYIQLWKNLTEYLSKEGDSVSKISPSVHCSEGSHYKIGEIDVYAILKEYFESIGLPARINVTLEAEKSEEKKVLRLASRIKALDKELLEIDANQETNYSKRETLKSVLKGQSDTILFLL